MIKSLASDIAEMVELISAHAKHEDNFIFNQQQLLLSWGGPIVRKLEQEHIELHERELNIIDLSTRLVNTPTKKDLETLQEELQDYKTVMWKHLEEEETQVNDAMNETFSVEEMAEIIRILEKSVEKRDKMLMTKYLFPAATTREKLLMMGDPNPSTIKVALLGALVFPLLHASARLVVAATSPASDHDSSSC
jgi:hemerythrin-like domain-containing protein